MKNTGEGAQRTAEMQITNLYSAISADRLVFNSTYNKKTFLDGAEKFLRKMPDHVPAGVCQSLEAKSQVVPVPLGEECFQGLAVQEAIASGCLPLVPDRLVYPEYIDRQWRYHNPDHAVELLQSLSVGELQNFDRSVVLGTSWATLGPLWKNIIDAQ